jgi:hypothetical protein
MEYQEKDLYGIMSEHMVSWRSNFGQLFNEDVNQQTRLIP